MEFNREKFKEIRKQQCWTLKALAEEIGVTRTTLSLWENGHKNPSYKHIFNLANIFCISANIISDVDRGMVVKKKQKK